MNTLRANIDYYDSQEAPPPKKIDARKAEALRREVIERTGGQKREAGLMLELGGGTGWLGCGLAASVFAEAIVSMDVSHRMLKATRDTAVLNDIDAVQGDAAILPFRDESFDFVCGGSFLHHTRDENDLFDEVHRVLKPGGFFLVYREPQAFGSRLVVAIVKLIVFLPGLFFRFTKRGAENHDRELGKAYSYSQLKEFGDRARLPLVACQSHSFCHSIHWYLASKLKSFNALYAFAQSFEPFSDAIDEKILKYIFPGVFFYNISACYKR
ncbi:MAG: class I SAM-dependent methyltransferase [bacterium]